MKTLDKTTEGNSHEATNQSAHSSASWSWNLLSYLWGNPEPASEAEQPEPDIFTNESVQANSVLATPQDADSLRQQNFVELQQANRPVEEQNQPEGTSLPMSVLASPCNTCDLASASTIPEPSSTVDLSNTQILSGDIYTSDIFRPSPSPTNVPHPGRDFIEQITSTMPESINHSRNTMIEPTETPIETKNEEDRLGREQEERTAALRLQEQSRQAALLLQQEQEQRRIAAQTAEEKRKAEDAFSRRCSTGARTLEEHYRLARAAANRAGF